MIEPPLVSASHIPLSVVWSVSRTLKAPLEAAMVQHEVEIGEDLRQTVNIAGHMVILLYAPLLPKSQYLCRGDFSAI